MTDQQKKQVESLYIDFSCTEIAKMIGVTAKAINMYAYHHKLQHSPQCVKRLRQKANHKMVDAHTDAIYLRAKETNKKLLKMEYLRLLSGEKQKTKKRLSILPKKMRLRMIHLCYTYRYFRDEDINCTVLYYDSETNRNMTAENNARERYGIKFEKADE